MNITPLHAEHLRRGARIIEFAGWQMPLQFSGILEEHRAVRAAAGLFDISHMGQIEMSGPGAADALESILTNRVAKVAPGACQYTLLLNDDGGVLDDLIIYRREHDSFFLVVNAAQAAPDLEQLRLRAPGDLSLALAGDARAALALQGPRAGAIFQTRFGIPAPAPFRHLTLRVDGRDILAAGTGYTGERGCELFFPADLAPELWNSLLDTGAPLGIRPCGLGARDTLRMEMGYPLGGHELLPSRTPLEARLDAFVDLDKPRFVGRDALLAQRAAGVPWRLTPFTLEPGAPPPRAGYEARVDGSPAGEVTSGCLSPSLGRGIGMAYIAARYAAHTGLIEIVIRDRPHPATIASLPFYRREKG